MDGKARPDCIKHWRELQRPDDGHYPGSDELLSIGAPFGKHFGFKRLGIHHELVPPGRRTSWPHAESAEDEFVFVVSGRPHAWIDGEVYQLEPGDAVGFPAGTGIAHTFLNDTDEDVQLLVIGDTNREENRCVYPVHPRRNEEIGEFLWKDAPRRRLGPHDGMPKALRDRTGRPER